MNRNPRDRRVGSAVLRSSIALAIALLVVWLANSGHYTAWMISLGVLSCAGVVALSLRMGLVDEERGMLQMATRLPGYLPWLVLQIIKANIDVAWRILAPGHRISPTLVRIKALSRSDTGVVAFANSITLTPGTISIRVRDGYVLVHGLTQEAVADLEAGEMNRRVAALEGGPACTPSS